MNITKKSFYLFFILLILAVSIRACLFYTYWGSERHGSAVEYGSAAIGLFYSEKLTINKSEQKKIRNVTTNYSGNYLSFHDVENRKTFTEFLPGPSILLYSLWKVLPIYNFSPYIWLQIILESFLISIFYFTFRHIDKTIVLTATILMAINPVAIKYTLRTCQFYRYCHCLKKTKTWFHTFSNRHFNRYNNLVSIYYKHSAILYLYIPAALLAVKR